MKEDSKLIEILKEYKDKIDLETRFNYPFNIDSNVFTEDENRELSVESIFRKNVKLKGLIQRKYNGSFKNQKLNFWIINSWGGIQTFKHTDKNELKIEKFSKQLQLPKKKLTAETFYTISSLSKIASFFDPDNYVIYDSRVIYAMNWFILNSKPNDLKFFPMPSSRNSKLVDFDLNTIINLLNLDGYNKGDSFFYDVNEAYFVFCNLIKDLSKKVYEDATVKPYLLEMLLFTVAVDEVLNEVKTRTFIEIKNEFAK